MKHVRISDHLEAEVEAIATKEQRSLHYVANKLMEEAIKARKNPRLTYGQAVRALNKEGAYK